MTSTQNGTQNGAQPEPIWDGFAVPKAPLFYMEMPKSACTTIKNILYQIEHDGAAYHAPLAIHADPVALLKTDNPDREAYWRAVKRRRLCFTFVREPYARAYSAFNEKFFYTGPYHFPQFRAVLVERYGVRFPDAGGAYSAGQHAENFAGFLRFVEDTLSKTAEIKPDPHWMPQAMMMARHAWRIGVDFIGRTERFAEDMRYVLDVSDVTTPIDLTLRYNEGPPAPYKLREIMTDQIAEALASIYGKDVVHYAYEDLSARHLRQT